VTAEPLRVTWRDARALSYCARGCRDWCARHGLSWEQMRREGLDAEAVAATGDAMALRLVEYVRRERG